MKMSCSTILLPIVLCIINGVINCFRKWVHEQVEHFPRSACSIYLGGKSKERKLKEKKATHLQPASILPKICSNNNGACRYLDVLADGQKVELVVVAKKPARFKYYFGSSFAHEEMRQICT